MSTETIITLVALGIPAISGIIGLFIAIVRGKLKNFIVKQMEIAEKSGLSGAKKLDFVLQAVKEEYKLTEKFLNVKKFIEYIISITKQINYK